MVKIVWITHEQRSRDIIPIILTLKREGHDADVHFTDIFSEEICHPYDGDDEKIVVIQSSEDFSYAEGVWSWDKTGEIKTIHPTSIASLVQNSSRVILIHPHHEGVDLHDDIKAMNLMIEASNDSVLSRITEQFPLPASIPRAVTAVLPLAKRLVFIRHAQRLDEINTKWCDLAERPQDSPLTDMGVEQARHVSRWLSAQAWCQDIHCVLVSPFIRTVQTAHYATDTDELRHTRICVEHGLAEGAAWMAQNGQCRTPWFLRAADLCAVSNRIDLDYQSVKHPQFEMGETYPGRPVEQEEWYDRCAQTIWRLARQPQHEGKTLVLVTHAGCVNFLVHALSGRLMPMVGHTAVTSLVCDEFHGKYAVECAEGTDEELFVSQHHLPEAMRTGAG